MEFFRIENGSGKGPYTSYNGPYEMLLAHNEGHYVGTHPAAWKEHRGVFKAGLDVCGFNSLDKLITWFEGFGDILHDHGFHMAVYEVPEDHVIVGEKQDIIDARKLGRQILVMNVQGV